MAHNLAQKLIAIHLVSAGGPVELVDRSTHRSFRLKQDLTPEELATLQADGLINRVRQKLKAGAGN